MTRVGVVILSLLAAPACGDAVQLTVDVRTDWQPFVDFDAVETEISRAPFEDGSPSSGGRSVRTEVDGDDDYLAGQRVVELDDLDTGRVFVRVTLRNGAGAPVAQRVVDLELAESFALTVVLTRDCRTVTCPGSGDPPGLSECLNGRCVDPRCTTSSPEYCAAAVCVADADCPAGAGCDDTRCEGGVCLCESPTDLDAGPGFDGGAPDAGVDGGAIGVDAGPTPDTGPCGAGAACAPGEVQSGVTCGMCGTEERTCGSDCAWGAWSCVGEGVCVAGTTQTDTQACGACNSGTRTRTRTCSSSCTWGSWSSYGACSGATGCAPGSTTACANGDSCGHRVCQSDCTWSGCQPIYECLRIRPGTSGPEGNNYRCCGTSRWQFCLPSCYWSTDCVTCSGCGC